MGIAFLAGNEQSANECVKKQLECAISLGPMLRADHWEATAVPELRAHAEQLARHLVAPSGAG